MIPVAVAGAIITAIAALTGVWINDRRNYQKLVLESNGKLVDQLQEERHEIKSDLRSVKGKVELLLLQGRYKDDYINVLRSHIETGKPPPPPGYPPELLRIAMEGL